MTRSHTPAAVWTAFALAVCLTGCTVGPNYNQAHRSHYAGI